MNKKTRGLPPMLRRAKFATHEMPTSFSGCSYLVLQPEYDVVEKPGSPDNYSSLHQIKVVTHMAIEIEKNRMERPSFQTKLIDNLVIDVQAHCSANLSLSLFLSFILCCCHTVKTSAAPIVLQEKLSHNHAGHSAIHFARIPLDMICCLAIRYSSELSV